jgi:hypothetical protein
MSKLTVFVSATIVLILLQTKSWAAPSPDVPDAPKTQDQNGSAAEALPPGENMSITPAPPVPKVPAKDPSLRYYTAKQALTVRGGIAMNLSDNDAETENLLGVQYLVPKFLSPRIEIGADLHTDDSGHIHAGLRKLFSERSYFRPSVKAGLDVLLIGEEQLASAGNINNYYMRTGAAIEYVFWNPYSVRLEAEILFGLKRTQSEFSLGLSRGW